MFSGSARRLLSAGVFLLSAALMGCATVGGTFDPAIEANAIASGSGLRMREIQTPHFALRAYSKAERPGKRLRVYIEGDGLAWISKNRLSNDPTPQNPMVLTLASLDPSPNVAYLARPCQYSAVIGAHDACNSDYWSGARFSEEVVVSMNEAVSQLKAGADASILELVGYSGGGAIAVLVAARRSDVISIRTIAGNLDHEALNRFHGVKALKRSLNPADEALSLARLPQIHYIGADDKIVPRAIAEGYRNVSGDSACVDLRVIRGASHQDGWVERWPDLVRDEPTCSPL